MDGGGGGGGGGLEGGEGGSRDMTMEEDRFGGCFFHFFTSYLHALNAYIDMYVRTRIRHEFKLE